MKAFFTRLSLFLILGFVGLFSKAETITIDEIIYELNDETSTATVHKADGNITTAEIKSSVTYNNTDYVVTEIDNSAFSMCGYLTSVTIPNSVTKIGERAFYRCGNLTSVTIGKSTTSIGKEAFYNTSLESVTIPGSVTEIGEYAFCECSGLESISVETSNRNYADIDGVLYDKNITILIQCPSAPREVTIPNSVKSIGNKAFYNCSIQKSVIIPNSVSSIGDEAFCNGTILTSVTIPSSVSSIGDKAFSDCYLNSISVDKSNLYYADIEGVLYDKNISFLIQCPGAITEVTIPNSVTSIGSYAFSSCKNLKEVTIPNSVTSIGAYAFSACWNLSSVTISNSVTEIADGTFSNCDLTSITIPYSVTKIGFEAFYNCSSLEKVIIPNSVTSISSSAFVFCMSLTEVTIPNSITYIGNRAFDYCTSLTSVYYGAQNPIESNRSTFTSSTYGDATLYVLETAVEKCKEIDPWKNFKNIVAYEFPTILAESVKLDKEAVELKVGETAILTATVMPEDATDKSVTWASSDEAIATVDAEGVVTAIAIGQAVITATCGEAKAECNITVKPVPAESVKLDKEAIELKVGETATLTATVMPEDATDKSVTWASSDEAIATVDGEGVVTAIAVGQAVITATCGEAKAECKVTVNPVPAESVKLDKEAIELKIGETATLTATVAPENATDKSVTWASSDEAIATVDGEGVVTAIAVGQAVITATCGEAKAECNITVKPVPAESVKLDKEAVELKVGETATLTATIAPDNATYKTVTWESSNPDVATVDAEGVVTAIAVGQAVITATCGETKAECKVTVTTDSGIEAAEANEPMITLSPMTINVSGVSGDCKVSVYTINGELIAEEKGCCSIAVANRGVYVVKVGNKTFKVSVTR